MKTVADTLDNTEFVKEVDIVCDAQYKKWVKPRHIKKAIKLGYNHIPLKPVQQLMFDKHVVYIMFTYC